MIKDVLQKIWEELPQGVRLVAISKYHPVEAISEAYSAGQRMFGENHVQELLQKVEHLPSDIEWHFTGHLQTNKVKYIASFISLIHSVDSEKLLREIDKQGRKVGRRIQVLLELHVAEEDSKYGFSEDELVKIHESGLLSELSNVEIRGIMCMATNTDDDNRINSDFAKAKDIFDSLKQRFYANCTRFNELSMGMSDDYHLALSHGTTLVRIGTKIFGERIYSS